MYMQLQVSNNKATSVSQVGYKWITSWYQMGRNMVTSGLHVGHESVANIQRVSQVGNNKATNNYCKLTSGKHRLFDPSCGLIMANTLIS